MVTFLPLLILLPALPSAWSAIPIHVSPGINITLPGQAGVNCTDLSTGFSPKCFLSEDIPAQLKNYNISFLPETCAPYQTWSQCFQLSAFAAAGTGSSLPRLIAQEHNCTQLSLNATGALACRPPNPNAKPWHLVDWYGVWNIYSLQSHVSVWAQAMLSTGAQPAITNLTTAYPSYNASRVLATLINRYGIATDKMADAALIQGLLYARNSSRVPSTAAAYPPGHRLSPQRVPLPDEARGPSVQAWQQTLQARLEELLRIAMGDFDRWFDVIAGGWYSAPAGYATAGLLVGNMERGF